MPSTIRKGSSGPDVAQWQRLIGVSPADGIFGAGTDAATRAWQSAHGLGADGIVGPASWSAALGGSTSAKPQPDGALPPVYGPPAPPGTPAVAIARVPGIEHLSASDLAALSAASHRLGIDPSWLAAAMSFETGGTFSPSVRNKAGSGATGLIQFMPSTAAILGTSTDALARMTFQQQLPYVEKYFAPHAGKMHSLDDVYLAIFYPAAIGKPPGTVVATQGSAIYAQNAGFDKGGAGFFTVADITAAVNRVLDRAKGMPPLVVAAASTGGGLLLVGLAIAAFWFLTKGSRS